MDSFAMKIAGLVAEVHPMFETTREYCRDYLTNGKPDLFVTVRPEDLSFEQTMLEREAIEEGMKIRKFSDPFLERTSIQRQIAEALLDRETLLIHGSTVAVDGYAYLFTAPCGTGKSTHTRLWREAFGERAVMINDDKPFLQITDTGVIAFGSPWSGKHGLHRNFSLPLRGICILNRGKENMIHRISSADGFDFLFHQTFVPEDHTGQEKASILLTSLLQKVPLWKMSCNKHVDAAVISYRAMSSDIT